MFLKNGAGQFLTFVLVKASDGTALTGASPAGVKSGDGAAQGAVTGGFTEQGGGQYEFALSQADINYDEVGFLFTAATAIPVNITLTTETKKIATLNDFAINDAVNLADNAITASKYDESTAYPVASADTGASQIARVGADGDTLETLSDEIAALPDAAAINAEVDTALSDIHLDHLLGVTYDPASKPGVADALLNEIIESDSGVSRFTANALEQAAVGDATLANQTLILEDLADIEGTGFVKDTDSLVDLAHIGADADTLETISDQIDAVPDAAAINAQVDAAIVTYHLDHLLHTAYADEGAAGSIFEDLIVDNAGTYEYTTAALQNAPGATGDATEAKQDLILEDIVDMKGTAFAKDTHSLVDLALASSLSTTDGKIDTIDGIVDNILTDTGTTLDGKIDNILTDTGTTLDGAITTIDGIVDTIKDILEGDHYVDTATTPWQYLIRKNTDADWLTPLVQQDMTDEAGANVVATTTIVARRIAP